ncbi:MAG: protein phosphatase CheZ [Marivibrio sp.]|uniref:protein phosphatase CheZ n=1 Tax=Marivibrio sp. TaxID=2039719 RepID=UPI0032EC3405
MSAHQTRKPFRIERGLEGLAPPDDAAGGEPGAEARHREVMAALQAMSGRLDALESAAPPAPPAPAPGVDAEAFRQQILEAETLRGELQQLSDAIQRTKEEIVSLRRAPRGDDKIGGASEALRAVVGDTEQATDVIIEAAEAIEELGGRLAAQSDDPAARELTDALGDHVTQIFEACNFQDITGQRITRVVQTMEFIDERVARMMDIWGGDAAFADATPAAPEETAPKGEILDGPSAAPDQKISQEDIDKLFD